ncbi:MAG: hypothetical protein QG566_784 [Patescibacteria group bacterium]|jgi:cell division protein FtsB|nr:hypothetical protein [Patescibacteria group bacterium]
MAEFQTKQHSKKMWHSPLSLFVLLVVLLVFMYNMVGLVEIKNETTKKNQIALNEMESVLSREIAIKSTINKLSTDLGKEETLRDKYHLVKEGEKMVVIVNQEASALNVVDESKDDNGFIKFFKNLFR